MGWEVVVIAVLAVVCLPLIGLYVRRRVLGRHGEMFDCSVRLSEKTPSAGWVLGVARYSDEELQWYRSFSLRLNPRLAFRRTEVTLGQQREPTPVEAVTLYADQRIVGLGTDVRRWELAMSQGALMGLMAWLEAAPPGSGRYGRPSSPSTPSGGV